MLYFEFPPKAWQDFIGGAREKFSEWFGDAAEWMGEEAADIFTRTYENIGGELGRVMTKGLKEAGLEEAFKDSLDPLQAISAQINLAILDSFKSLGEAVGKSWNNLDQAAFDFAKQTGLAKQQAEEFRNRILDVSRAGAEFGKRYGKTLDQVMKLQNDFASSIGRTVRMTNEQFEDISALSAVVGDEMAVKFSAQLDNFGMSTSAAGELMTQMYNESVKKGISLQAYSKNVTDNLHLAQQYTFKDGVKGLMSMAENATKLKMDMQQVVTLANKLTDGGLDAAVNMGADLQVLGGPFAQFGDPLGMLHDGLLDVENLSKRLTDMVGDMGHFDKEKGELRIDTFNQMRLREAAKAMGVDYGKLVESATHQAKRNEIDVQMAGLDNIPEHLKEFIMNTAQFQNGRAGITDKNGAFRELSTLSADDIADMAKYAQSDSENIRDIAEMLRGALDVQKGQEAELENVRAEEYADKAEKYKSIYSELAGSKEALLQIVKYQKITASIQSISQVGGVIGNFAAPFLKFLGKANGGLIKTHSDGDIITNGTPGREYVLNSAQYGEFIVNAQSTKHHLGLLRAINADKNGSFKIKQHDSGGMLGGVNGMMGVDGGFGYSSALGNITLMSMIHNSGFGQFFATPNKFLDKRLDFKVDYDKMIKENLKQSRLYNLEMRTLSKNSVAYNNIVNKNLALETQRHELIGKRAAQEAQLGKITAQNVKLAKGIKIAGGIGGTALAGVSGYFSAKSQYEATGEAIMNKQKAQAGSIGAGIGAAAGAALGAFAGPIGMMIGSTIGQMAGQYIGETIGVDSDEEKSAARDQHAMELASKSGLGSNKFVSLKGDFDTKEQNVIAKGLEDGHLYDDEIEDKDLIKKLQETGNSHLIEKRARGGWVRNARPHSSGGGFLGIRNGRFINHELNEYVVDTFHASNSPMLLEGISSGRFNDTSIVPIEPMGKQMHVNERYARNSGHQSIKVEPISIQINGSIKLEGNGTSIDISKEIMRQPMLINKIADMIAKQFNIDDNAALDMKKYYRK